MGNEAVTPAPTCWVFAQQKRTERSEPSCKGELLLLADEPSRHCRCGSAPGGLRLPRAGALSPPPKQQFPRLFGRRCAGLRGPQISRLGEEEQQEVEEGGAGWTWLHGARPPALPAADAPSSGRRRWLLVEESFLPVTFSDRTGRSARSSRQAGMRDRGGRPPALLAAAALLRLGLLLTLWAQVSERHRALGLLGRPGYILSFRTKQTHQKKKNRGVAWRDGNEAPDNACPTFAPLKPGELGVANTFEFPPLPQFCAFRLGNKKT